MTESTAQKEAPSNQELQRLRRDFRTRSILQSITELLFTLLPFIVLLMVTAAKTGQVQEILAESEWSFAAAILFGQTIVRIVGGVTHEDIAGNARSENVVLTIAMLIVLGLVPSMVIMTMVLLQSPHVQSWLGAAQVLLFLVAVAFFVSMTAAIKEVELQGSYSKRNGIRGWPAL